MFKSLKISIYFVLLIVLAGCSTSPSPKLASNKKAFAEEDIYILSALRMEQVKNHRGASNLFEVLYEQSDKKEYLYRSLNNDLVANDNEKLIQRVDALTLGKVDDFIMIRLKIIALIKLNRLEEAKDLGLILVEKSKEIDDYLLVSGIYVKDKQFDTALKYLEGAYVKDYNEKILDKMSIILYVNLHRKKDAIAQLETHSRMHSCSRLICQRLAGFYSNDNNVDGLLSTYLRLYQMDSKKGIADKIVQIYGYKKDYIKLMNFLEENSVNDELLFELYIQNKNYIKAAPLADKLYKNSGNIDYLGQSAIFEYESTKDKNDETMQKSVIKKLKSVISKKRDTIYLNYLGYILIDHNIDVKEGIKYIKESLEKEPNSAYYLDSLAWGYYRLGECREAKKIMNRVTKMKGSDNPEVKKHIQAINKCKNNKKKVK